MFERSLRLLCACIGSLSVTVIRTIVTQLCIYNLISSSLLYLPVLSMPYFNKYSKYICFHSMEDPFGNGPQLLKCLVFLSTLSSSRVLTSLVCPLLILRISFLWIIFLLALFGVQRLLS